jgi:hypothetical protein
VELREIYSAEGSNETIKTIYVDFDPNFKDLAYWKTLDSRTDFIAVTKGLWYPKEKYY